MKDIALTGLLAGWLEKKLLNLCFVCTCVSAHTYTRLAQVSLFWPGWSGTYIDPTASNFPGCFTFWDMVSYCSPTGPQTHGNLYSPASMVLRGKAEATTLSNKYFLYLNAYILCLFSFEGWRLKDPLEIIPNQHVRHAKHGIYTIKNIE